MPISYFPLSVDVSQIVGTEVKKARLHVATNLPAGTPIAYGADGKIAVPGGVYALPGGVGSVTLPTKAGATNVSSWQYVITGEYSVDGVRPIPLDPIYIDAPATTAAVNLASFVGVTSVPATFMGAAVAQLQAKVDEAEAIKQYVNDVSSIDTTVSAVDFALSQPGPADTLNAAIVDNRPTYLPEPNGTNDTAVIQAALTAAATAGGGVVRARERRVYRAQQAGTQALRNASGSTSTVGYCLRVPPGVTLDLNGSTLRLNSGDTRLLMNLNANNPMGTVSDSDLGVINGTLDGNGQQFSNAQLATFVGCRRLTLDNLRVTNGKGGGVLIYNDEDGTYDRLVADNWNGNAFSMGTPLTGSSVRNAHIGSIRGRDIGADTVAPGTFPGNLLYAALVGSTVGTVECVNAAGGIKFDAGSDTTIGQAVYRGGPLASANSGIKLQGFDATRKTRRFTVGSVVAEGCAGSGLYIDQFSDDCTVQSYTGEGNAPTGASPDVWLSGTRNKVVSLQSNNAGGQALLVRAEAAEWNVGTLNIYNPNTAAVGNAASVISPNVGRIGRIIALDDRGAGAKMNRALAVEAAAAAVEVGPMDIRGAVQLPITSASGSVSFGPLRCHASDAMHGIVTLAAGSSTTVTNGNFRNDAFTVYYRPKVVLTPMNVAARTLAAGGTVYPVPAAGSMSIKHGTAAGTEIFRWEITNFIRENYNLT